MRYFLIDTFITHAKKPLRIKMYIIRQQRQRLELLSIFLIGVTGGVILSRLVRHSNAPLVQIASQNRTQMTADAVSLGFGTANASHLAARLYKEVRILCMVLTAPKNHKTQAMHIKRTWGRRCNKLLFMSSAADAELGTVKLPVREGYTNQWNKTRESLRHVYKQHLHEADWFLLTDDNTYAILENLRGFLHTYAAEAPIYFGTKQQAQKKYVGQGDAGYVLSRAAVRRFIEQAYPNARICKQLPFGFQDKELARCLHNVGVFMGDSRDEQQLQRFYAWSPLRTFTCSWPQQESAKDITDCCSANAIAFHNTYSQEFYILDYIIYKLSPFGIVRPTDVLPAKLAQPAN